LFVNQDKPNLMIPFIVWWILVTIFLILEAVLVATKKRQRSAILLAFAFVVCAYISWLACSYMLEVSIA
jgi:hypothetical protein